LRVDDVVLVKAERPDVTAPAPFTGERVAFSGRLECLSRAEAEALVRRLGGSVLRRVSTEATLLVVGEGGSGAGPGRGSLGAAAGRRDRTGVRVLSESEFCERAGIPSSAELHDQYHALGAVRSRYPELREDRIRYLEKWGLVRPAEVTRSERYYTFDQLALLVSIHERLARGEPLRSIVNDLVAERHGQLSLELGPRTPGATVLSFPHPFHSAEAETWFRRGSELESQAGQKAEAAAAYARALEIDPELVPALINLANLHYLRNELESARALYRRAEELGGEEFFQIPFNLANIAHDREEYVEARRLYERALQLEPVYADAHFYLALTLEKLGRSEEAAPHWRAYRILEPDGEWVELAREMELR
jgi:tetratricopeptide (TPR) repeat protein